MPRSKSLHIRAHTQKKLGFLIGNITIFGYWRYTITIRLIQTIPLQLCDTRTNAMGYAQRRLGATCRCVHCLTISVWTSMPSGQLDKVPPYPTQADCFSSSSRSVSSHSPSPRRRWRAGRRRPCLRWHRLRRPEAPSLRACCDAPYCAQWVRRSRAARRRWRTTRTGIYPLPLFLPSIVNELVPGRFR